MPNKPFRSRSNLPPPDEGGIDAGGESLTRQEFKDECDINRIMKRALRTGVLPSRADTARYGDFSSVEDFRAAQDIILRAQLQFESLGSDIRDRFQNDPTRFLAFVGDPANKDEARKMGLLKDEKPAMVPVRFMDGSVAPAGSEVVISKLETPKEGK